MYCEPGEVIARDKAAVSSVWNIAHRMGETRPAVEQRNTAIRIYLSVSLTATSYSLSQLGKPQI
jgi:hypothetical protein